MPGKRLRDPSLIRTTFPEVVANNGEILTDWEVNNPSNQLVWARPIPLKLIGNSWMQGSYDGLTWDNYIKDDHNYLQVSTDGGETWRLIDLTGFAELGDLHPPVTIGNPDGGLVISGDDTQVLTLNPASSTNAGSMSAPHYIKLEALKFDYLENIGGAYELYKEYYDSGDDRFHRVRTLAAGANTTLSYVGDTIVISSNTSTSTGQANYGHNDGTLGYGVYDRINGEILEFRHVAPEIGEDVLVLRLDDIANNIHFQIVQENIDHNILDNYDPNEHVDHTTVLINTIEGIQGGGDITTSRTLLLDFYNLDTLPEDLAVEDWFAVYDTTLGHHYKVQIQDIIDLIPSIVDHRVIAGAGLSTIGTELLDPNTTLRLNINTLSTGIFDPTDGYIAYYDSGDGNHYKALLSSVIGTVIQVDEGYGIDLTPDSIVSTGTVGLQTPTDVNQTSTNTWHEALLGRGHTHTLVIDNLTFIGDVDNSPVVGEFLQWSGTTWITADPAIGATSPGDPNYSIQFNDNGVFGGDAGLLYRPDLDTILFTDPNTSTGATILFGSDATTDPFIRSLNQEILISAYGDVPAQSIQLYSDFITAGEALVTENYFFGIKDTGSSTYTLRIDDISDNALMLLEQTGEFYIPQIGSKTDETNVLYFDPLTGEVTYGAAPGGGGTSVTLVADILSGLMVNGGTTSSASIIELDQNDNKLSPSTMALDDYIGFWDVSLGQQSKTHIENIPGWNLYIEGTIREEINPGNLVNFVGENGILVEWRSESNTVAISGSGSGACDQAVVDLGSFSTGTANFNLDTYAGAIIRLTSGGTVTISMDNLEEGDTGHIEVSHTGTETLQFSAPNATAIHIANNSYLTTNTVNLSSTPTIDIIVFWYAKGLLHLAVVYNSHI